MYEFLWTLLTLYLEKLQRNNYTILITFLQDWMAFTNLRIENFTLTESLVFTNNNSPSQQDNSAVCQVRFMFTQKPNIF